MKSEKIIKVNCPQCGSWDSSCIIKTPDYEMKSKNEFEVSRCLFCGNIYTSIRPDMKTLYTKHYPNSYLCYGNKDKKYFFSVNQTRINMQALQRVNLVDKYLQHKTNIRVLELGCATGEFLKVGKQNFGWNVTGLEPNKKLCKILSQENIPVINSVMETAKISYNYYDVVCLFNVFEHLWDSTYSLTRINKFLKMNGLVAMEIPDFNATARIIFGKFWFLYHLPRHLSFFTRNSLDKLMKKTGFEQVIILKQFRPNVNVLSLKYVVRENSKSSIIKKFASENNPIIISLGIILELLFNFCGNSNHIIAIYKKVKPIKIQETLIKSQTIV